MAIFQQLTFVAWFLAERPLVHRPDLWMSRKRRPRTSRLGGFARNSGEDRGCNYECLGRLLCVHCETWTYWRSSKRSWCSSTAMADLSAFACIQPAPLAAEFSPDPQNRKASLEQQR